MEGVEASTLSLCECYEVESIHEFGPYNHVPVLKSGFYRTPLEFPYEFHASPGCHGVLDAGGDFWVFVVVGGQYSAKVFGTMY